MASERPGSGGLLGGVRVLDLTIWRPGPYATQLLAEVGAEVIKVEPPGGDPMRTYPGLFESLHADKRGLVLDLKSDGDRERALELAAGADVVVEGYRPGVAARLGVGYDQVRARNAEVVYCSLSGYGQTGPLVDVPGHDVNYAAWSGTLAPDGGPPSVPAIPIADLAGGMAAAFSISAALVRRLRTGEGEHIDVSMTDVLATWTGVVAPQVAGAEEPPAEADAGAGAAAARGVPGYGTFPTADGRYLSLGVISEPHFWRALCIELGLTEHADLDFVARSGRVDELQQLLRDEIGRHDRDPLVARLLAAGVPVAPVLTRAELAASPELRARGVVTRDPWSGPDGVAIGHPVRLVRHPAGRTTPAPSLDEHPTATWTPR